MPIPLEQPRFWLSDDAKVLFVELVESMPPDHPDPVAWVPEFSQTIEVPLPRAATRKPRAEATIRARIMPILPPEEKQ